MKFATLYENEFAKIVMGNSIKTAEQERRSKQKELNSLLARDKELDLLFEKIYEDNTLGRISDDRFSKLSVKYETEQKENENQHRPDFFLLFYCRIYNVSSLCVDGQRFL